MGLSCRPPGVWRWVGPSQESLLSGSGLVGGGGGHLLRPPLCAGSSLGPELSCTSLSLHQLCLPRTHQSSWRTLWNLGQTPSPPSSLFKFTGWLTGGPPPPPPHPTASVPTPSQRLAEPPTPLSLCPGRPFCASTLQTGRHQLPSQAASGIARPVSGLPPWLCPQLFRCLRPSPCLENNLLVGLDPGL